MRRQWRLIASVAKTHGRMGQIVAVPIHGLPPLLRPDMHVAVLPPMLRTNRYHKVLRVTSEQGSAGQLVCLSDVSDLEVASKLVGCVILAVAEELPDDLGRCAVLLVGRKVSDLRLGPLGEIEEVMTTPANDVWVVRGPLGEILIPVVDSIVMELPETGEIAVDLPDGIVGL